MNLSELSPLRTPFDFSFKEKENFFGLERKINTSPFSPMHEVDLANLAMDLMQTRIKEVVINFFNIQYAGEDSHFFNRKMTRGVRFALSPSFPFLNTSIDLFKKALIPCVKSLNTSHEKRRFVTACMESLSISQAPIEDPLYQELLKFFESMVSKPYLLYEKVISSAFDQLNFKSFEIHLKRAQLLGIQNKFFDSKNIFLTRMKNLVLAFFAKRNTFLTLEEKRNHLKNALQEFHDALDIKVSFSLTEIGIRVFTLFFKHAELEKEDLLFVLRKLKTKENRKIVLTLIAFQASCFADHPFFYYFSKNLSTSEIKEFFRSSMVRFMKRLLEVGHNKDSQVYRDVKKWVTEKSVVNFFGNKFESEFEQSPIYPEPSLYLIDCFDQ